MKDSIGRALEIEETAAAHAGEVVAWSCAVSCRGPLVELYLALSPSTHVRVGSFAVVDDVRYPLIRAGSVGTGDEAEIGVRRLLVSLGLPEDLPSLR